MNTKLLPQHSNTDAASVQGANVTDILLSQQGVPVMATPRGTLRVDLPGMPPLRNHIPQVIALSAEEQMSGVDAQMHIASVADVQTRGNGAGTYGVRETVGQDVATVSRDAAIAGVNRGASPQPAGIGLLDPCPELAHKGVLGYNVHVNSPTKGWPTPGC